MNVQLELHIQCLWREMCVQIELNVVHLPLLMSNYRSKECLAKFLKKIKVKVMCSRFFWLLPALIIGSIVNECPAFITPIALFSRQFEEMREIQLRFFDGFTRIMRNIRSTMKQSALKRKKIHFRNVEDRFSSFLLMNSVATIRTNNRTTIGCCMFLNFISDVSILCPWTNWKQRNSKSNQRKSFFIKLFLLISIAFSRHS